MAGPKPFLTKFGILHILKSCAQLCADMCNAQANDNCLGINVMACIVRFIELSSQECFTSYKSVAVAAAACLPCNLKLLLSFAIV